ncbi:MAG: ATP-binding cassette domain-containing protein [Myxococcota bacterium]
MRTKPLRRVPEVLQSSAMDCGPAALQAVLGGYGIESDYDELRSRCQTDVDGTSVYDLARLGRELGLSSSQVLVPRDTLLRASARCTPAIAVTCEGVGQMHFVVLWRTFGPWVQVMDPGTGRRWVRKDRLLARLPDVPVALTEERFARWRKTSFARDPLGERLHELGVSKQRGRELVQEACDADSWRPYATLDAATRMVATLVDGGAIGQREAARFLEGALSRAGSDGIPVTFWWIWQGGKPGTLSARGAPIVRFTGATAESIRSSASARPPTPRASLFDRLQTAGTGLEARSLAWATLSLDRFRDSIFLVGALALAGLIAGLDLLLLQGLLQSSERFLLPYYRAGAALALVVLSLGGLLLDWAVTRAAANLGRRLELRMRAALFEALPNLPDDYLRTRPTSDMAERGHSLHLLRRVPEIARRLFESIITIVVCGAGIVWLFPEAKWLTFGAASAMLALPWFLSRTAEERLVRARTHGINLERFYLDSLLGVVPIRVHAAELSVRREHESLLVEWLRAMLSVHSQQTKLHACQTLAGALFSVSLLTWYFAAGHSWSGALLVFYWSTRFPTSGSDYINGLLIYRSLELAGVRFFAPLRATRREGSAEAPQPKAAPSGAAEIRMHDVHVKAANRTVLEAVNLHVPSGQHVAIVGPSGAGKSSLVGLLLGWMKPLQGQVLVDGACLDREKQERLRSETAWLDPVVQIWNDTLIDNVMYGSNAACIDRLSAAARASELNQLLENLPEGLQTNLGEGGLRLSGGQGQRLRLTRALVRSDARLVILDEPFRGLERPQRQALLARVRATFRGATLLFVSHDIRDTEDFERVLVVAGGRIVEDAAPAELLARESSLYSAMLRRDKRSLEGVWNPQDWRRARMHDGQLSEPA